MTGPGANAIFCRNTRRVRAFALRPISVARTGNGLVQTSTNANGTMPVSVDTANAGLVSSVVTVEFLSAGRVAGLSNGLGELRVGREGDTVIGDIQANAGNCAPNCTLNLDSQEVLLAGRVYAEAEATLTGGSNVIDFGTVRRGDTVTVARTLTNTGVGALVDDLVGSWRTAGAPQYQFSGFGPFAGVAAGSGIGGLKITFDSSAFGPNTYTRSIFLDGITAFDGLMDVALAPIELRLTGHIRAENIGVPAPGTVLLIVFGLLGSALLRKRG